MKKQLHFISIAIAFALVCASILTSCGDDEPSNGSSTPGTNGGNSGGGNTLTIGSNFDINNIKFQVISNDKEIAAVGLVDKQVSSVEIPETVKHNGVTYRVVRIGIEHDDGYYMTWFNGDKNWGTVLRSIKIPESVTRITNDAFNGCSFLSDINIANGVVSIGWGAFRQTLWEKERMNQEIIYYGNIAYCLNLNAEKFRSSPTVIIKDGTKSIGDYLFSNLLESPSWNGQSPSYREQIKWSVVLPNSVTHIGRYAFYHNYSDLESVNMPSSLQFIGEYAFWNCNLFTSVTIPQSVTYIGKNAFGACYGLQEVHSKIKEPFPIEPKTFDNPNDEFGIKLFVPKGTRQKYLNTAGWNSIYEIVEE